MRLTTLMFILLTGSFSFIFAQNIENKLDFRIGVGNSLQGTGDVIMFNFENELNYTLNDYFAVAGGIGFGRNRADLNREYNASTIQGNLLIFYSPFKNSRRFDFRLGAGFGNQSYNYTYRAYARYENYVLVEENFDTRYNNSLGFQVAFEGTYMLNENYMMGLKLFTQPYWNGDINNGVTLKVGRRL